MRGRPRTGVGGRRRCRVMLAVDRPKTLYPVLRPEHWGPEGREATRRRRRRYPTISALTIAALAVLPFIAYVAAVSQGAHIGYQILHLTQDVSALETDHERLQAIASSLRAPDRIERVAMARLGLRAPSAGQTAALVLPPIEVRRNPPLRLGLWQRLGAYFDRSEAAAASPER
jgi:cell division protein FtsL